eukprot:14451554-Ditylum_brightwellii.AAC.1
MAKLGLGDGVAVGWKSSMTQAAIGHISTSTGPFSKFQVVSCTFRLWRSCFCGQLRKRGNQSGCKQQKSVWGMVLLW